MKEIRRASLVLKKSANEAINLIQTAAKIKSIMMSLFSVETWVFQFAHTVARINLDAASAESLSRFQKAARKVLANKSWP